MKQPLNFGITGVTLTGNMGGQAMFLTSFQYIQAHCDPGAHFYLFSIYPEQDKALNPWDNVTIVDASPLRLMLLYFPLALLMLPWGRTRWGRALLQRSSFFRALMQCEWVLDHCGIAFVDGRGLPLLLYNVACCLPAIATGIPLLKLSQALGPFHQTLNRVAAQFVLERCHTVVARGEKTAQFLTRLNLQNTVCLPDITFALEVNEAAHQKAADLWRERQIPEKVVIISPSRVVEQLSEDKGIHFKAYMQQLIQAVLDRGQSVLLLPHSLGRGKSKNNDILLAQEIYQSLEHDQLFMIDDVEDAVLLRALIGRGHLFLGCRFHAVVAAVSMAVPCIVVGWSHKYKEMVAPFGLEEWVYDLSEVSVDALLERLTDLETEREAIHQQIASRLPDIRTLTTQNYQSLSALKTQDPV